MPVNLVPEDEIRAALIPYRADPAAFEAGVRARLAVAEKEKAADPMASWSPFLRAAAAFLPLELLAGCKTAPAAATLAPGGGAYKLLSYLAFPAISLFVLLGATLFSVSKIRSIQDQSGSGLSDQEAIYEATREWWRRHKWGAMAVFAATLTLMMVGATWILFLFYLVSFGLLLLVLTSFAKAGLGNRQVIGRSCGMGLMFLGQGAMISGIGAREIHFLDQQLVSAIFLGGSLILLSYISVGSQLTGWRVNKMEKTPRWFWVFLAVFWLVQSLLIGYTWSMARMPIGFRAVITATLVFGALVPLAAVVFKAALVRWRTTSAGQWGALGFMAILLVPLMAWMMSSILWPVTPTRIKRYVESFDHGPVKTVGWRRWEIVAQWAIDSKLNPDLSRPRRLFAEEISGEQNPFNLDSALRVGLLPADQIGQLKDYEKRLRSLVADPPRGLAPQVITYLDQQDWVIRVAVLRDDLSSPERDLLEKRLLATLENMSKDKYAVLKTALRVTQLLEVIERPIDRGQYREMVHDLLRKFHTKNTGGFRLAGGFKDYLTWPAGSWFGQPGSVEATAYAVELMEIYGVPDGLDLNWVRSFLRPLAIRKISDDQWIAAAALARLNRLPGVARPTWLEVLYYERSLLAAIVLVGLCIFATVSAPKANEASAFAVQGSEAGQKSEVGG